MNMKKILSLGLAFALSISTLASAAYDSADAFKADMAKRTPTVTLTVDNSVKLADKAAIRTVAGPAFANKYATDENIAAYDFYKMNVAIKNLGELKNDQDDTANILGIYGITIGFETTGIKIAGAKPGSGYSYSGGQCTIVGKEKYFNLDMTCTATTNPWPTFDVDGNWVPFYTYDKETGFVFDAVVAVDKGASVTVTDYDAVVTYCDGTYSASVAMDPNDVTIGESKPAADVVVNSGDKYDNGYVWNVTVNKDMEAFGVKFYSGEDTLAKSVKNVDALPKLDGGVGYNFNVGLKTAKTIDQADFTADDVTASWKKAE